jgi:hypothetical protein
MKEREKKMANNYKTVLQDMQELQKETETENIKPLCRTLESKSKTTNIVKDTTGKIPWEIFPFEEAEQAVKVFEYGASKYGAPFYYRCGIDTKLLAAAVIRHATAILNDEPIDADSGCSHFAHIAANGLMGVSQDKVCGEIKF